MALEAIVLGMTLGATAVVSLVLAGVVALQAPPQAVSAQEAAEAAVLRAHDERVYRAAYRTLDASLLEVAWGGEALLDMQDDLARLRMLGQYLDLELEELTILNRVSLGPRRVRVATREQWLVRVYHREGVSLGYQRQTVENRYVVQQDGEVWRIVEVDQEITGGDRTLLPGEP